MQNVLHSHGCRVSRAAVSSFRSIGTMRLSGVLSLNSLSRCEFLKTPLQLQTMAKPYAPNVWTGVYVCIIYFTDQWSGISYQNENLTLSSCSIVYHILHITYSKLKHSSPSFGSVYNTVHYVCGIENSTCCWLKQCPLYSKVKHEAANHICRTKIETWTWIPFNWVTCAFTVTKSN